MRKKTIYGKLFITNPNTIKAPIFKLKYDIPGYSELLYFDKPEKPLIINDKRRQCALIDDKYKWLIIYPFHENWVMTAIYDDNNNIVEWYFDISRYNFIDDNGVPCFYDIYLDLVLLPNGEKLMLDEDELKEGLQNNQITKEDYELAYDIFNELADSKWTDIKYLDKYCKDVINCYYKEYFIK